MLGGISTLLLIMLLTGGKLGNGMASAFIEQRKQTYERWKTFVQFLQATVTQGYFYLRGIPVVKDAAGTVVFTNEAIMKQLQEGQKDNLAIWFFSQVLEKAVNLIMELIKPSTLEEQLMISMLGNFKGGLFGGNSSVTVVNQGQGPTPNQIRNAGGQAQGAIITPQGYVYDVN